MKLLLDTIGSAKAKGIGIKGYLATLFSGKKKSRVSPRTRAREQFEEEAKDQLEELEKKGLSIPIFTL